MKKLLDRIVVGAAIGILTGYLVTIIVNCGIGDGAYMPVMPVLEERCKTLMAAVLIQTLLTALIGVVFAVAGMIFEIESWSYLKQCVVHFFATVVFYLPFSFICWSMVIYLLDYSKIIKPTNFHVAHIQQGENRI